MALSLTEAVVSCIYALLFSILISKAHVFDIKGIGRHGLIFIFLLKCIFSILYFQLHSTAINSGDIFLYLTDANYLFDVLSEDPAVFVRLVFGPNGGEAPAALAQHIDTMWYWADPSSYLMVRIHSILRLVSFGFPWVNGVFMAFLSFSGICLLVRSIQLTHERVNRMFVWIAFLLPSVLFWASGYHKETVVTFAFGSYIFSLFHILNGRLTIITISGLFIGCLILFVIRDFFLLLSIPALLALLLSLKFKRASVFIFISVYFLSIITGSFMNFPGSNKSCLVYLKEKQSAFIALKEGNTFFDEPEFIPTLPSLIKALPIAMANGFLRPFPKDASRILDKVAAIENLLIILLILFALRRINVQGGDLPFLLFLFFFGLSIIVVAGLIVPNSGAVLRYRSVGLLLFLPSFFNLRANYNL